MSSHCAKCGKPLEVVTSVLRGLGPVCAAEIEAELERLEAENADRFDLEYNPFSMDIEVRRDNVKHFNIYQVFKHHSPTGFEWGYGGSGPADFALNILAMFIHGAPKTVKLWDGQKVSRLVWDLHQPFKWKFIATLDKKGGKLSGTEIREWIDERRAERAAKNKAA